jgi:hypothetical protein
MPLIIPKKEKEIKRSALKFDKPINITDNFYVLNYKQLKSYKAMKAKILIIVSGGLIQSVNTNNEDIEVTVVDYDRKDEGEDLVYVKATDPLNSIIFDISYPAEKQAFDELNEMKFFD